jgi:hypothetical protein
MQYIMFQVRAIPVERWTIDRPPTIEKIEALLRYADRAPGEVLGIMHPSQTAATIWKVASTV